MATLRLGQYELDQDLVFGTRTPYLVPNQYLVSTFGIDQGDISNVDTQFPYEDGTMFGEDYQSGKLVSFEINIWKKGQDARDELARIQSKWESQKLRRNPGEVTTLRMRKGNRTSIAYGRPRRFKGEWGAVELGWCPISCDFAMSDNYFYDDQISIEDLRLGIVPTSGLSTPVKAPVRVTQYADSQYTIEVGGTEPTWIMQKINGPLGGGQLYIDNVKWWQFNQILTVFDTVTIDPRPWRRMTLKNGTENWSGKYTADSLMLRQMKLEPGLHNMNLIGVDPTLRGNVQISFRNAYPTP